jgi:hypothetical protein
MSREANRKRAAAALSLSLLLGGASASAQGEAESLVRAAEAATGERGELRAGQALVPDVTADQPELARRQFRAGSELAAQGRWREALAAYRESHRIYPHATTLFNIGYCNARLGKLTLAYRLISAALANTTLNPSRRLSEERELVARQQQQLLLLRLPAISIVNAPPGIALAVDGIAVIRRREESDGLLLPEGDVDRSEAMLSGAVLYVDPGRHHIELRSGHDTQLHALELHEGERRQLAWRASPEPAPARPSAKPVTAPPRRVPVVRRPAEAAQRSTLWRDGGIGALLLGGAGFAVATAAGLVTAQASKELEQTCTSDGSCPPSEASTVSRYRTAAHLTNWSLGVGAVGVVAGASLLLVHTSRGGTRTGAAAGAFMYLTPTSVGLHARF